jgi:hypothetical protein
MLLMRFAGKYLPIYDVALITGATLPVIRTGFVLRCAYYKDAITFPDAFLHEFRRRLPSFNATHPGRRQLGSGAIAWQAPYPLFVVLAVPRVRDENFRRRLIVKHNLLRIGEIRVRSGQWNIPSLKPDARSLLARTVLIAGSLGFPSE